ncbi:fumarylacetoacetate hydrolase family protein [Streptomyces hygroscopicus]|uniref:fumarylacetoacetate hydrolase family protein n=1 Tax=Streptomyces hygroscopicus TaxID=1912 RepID=UPI003D7C18BB
MQGGADRGSADPGGGGPGPVRWAGGRRASGHRCRCATGSPDGRHLPAHPVVFTKPAASVIDSGQAVDPHTDLTSALDYEGEIGVIIGRRASKVSRDRAMDYVWGYPLINDVTARDLQRDRKQWFIGKSSHPRQPGVPWRTPQWECARPLTAWR